MCVCVCVCEMWIHEKRKQKTSSHRIKSITTNYFWLHHHTTTFKKKAYLIIAGIRSFFAFSIQPHWNPSSRHFSSVFHKLRICHSYTLVPYIHSCTMGTLLDSQYIKASVDAALWPRYHIHRTVPRYFVSTNRVCQKEKQITPHRKRTENHAQKYYSKCAKQKYISLMFLGFFHLFCIISIVIVIFYRNVCVCYEKANETKTERTTKEWQWQYSRIPKITTTAATTTASVARGNDNTHFALMCFNFNPNFWSQNVRAWLR